MRRYIYSLMTDEKKGIVAQCLKFFLFLLSLFYSLGVRIIVWCYQKRLLRSYDLDKPVISIGNLTLGGSGKTPLVERVAQELKNHDLKPVILIRGYMLSGNTQDNSLIPESDEAAMLAVSLRNIPVIVGRDRVRNAVGVEKTTPVDVFLLDDGFQHWRMKRNIDIVILDSTNPFGNGHLIPRGILREPQSSLSRAGIFILTKTDAGKNQIDVLKSQLKVFNPTALIVEAVHRPVSLIDLCDGDDELKLALLDGKVICSFCSIGDSSSFEKSLLSLGVDLKRNFSFMDHHIYDKKDIIAIIKYCQENQIRIVVTTQKDAVKLNSYRALFCESMQLLSLKIQMQFVKGEYEFFQRIFSLFNR